MGSIKVFKALLSTAEQSIILGNIKNEQFFRKNSWECQESNPGPLGAKRERYPLCYAFNGEILEEETKGRFGDSNS